MVATKLDARLLRANALVGCLVATVAFSWAGGDVSFAAPTTTAPARTNLALAANGGRVRWVTDPAPGTGRLIDDSPALLRAPDRPGRWVPPGKTLPQEIVLSFHGDAQATIERVSLEGKSGSMAKDVEIHVSVADDPSSGFRRVASAGLQARFGEQAVDFAPTAARFVKVKILSHHGRWGLALDEIRVYEAAGRSILPSGFVPTLPGATLPVATIIDPRVPSWAARALPVAVGEAVEFPLGVEPRWFSFTTSDPPSVIHVGTLNTPGAMVTVHTQQGVLLESRAANGEPSGWHGILGGGRYLVQLDWQKGPNSRAGKRASSRPAQLQIIANAVQTTRTPAEAAQLGLDYLQVESAAWQNAHHCNGCHIQSHTLIGMAIAKRRGYRVLENVGESLGEFLAINGEFRRDDLGLYRQLGLRYYGDLSGRGPPEVYRTLAGKLMDQLARRSLLPWKGTGKLPVESGEITATALALDALEPFWRSSDQAVRLKGQRLLAASTAALSRSEPRTVQEHAMRLLALVQAGAERRQLSDAVARLLGLQNPDGGFGERPGGGPSNAYGTGQALHALRTAGLSVAAPNFQRAVRWLLDRQDWDGSWPLRETAAASNSAQTMWAVIGLAGAHVASGTPESEAGVARALRLMMVPIRVTVRDARNQGLTDLQIPDVTVLENGKPQRVVRLEREQGDFSIALVMDSSGSIAEDLPTMIKAAQDFVDLLPAGDRVSLIEFDDRVRPATAFTTDRRALHADLARLAAGGGTALYDALAAGLDRLNGQPDPRAVVLVTDGKDENNAGTGPGSRARLGDVLRRIGREQVPVYALGLGDKIETPVLQQLAGASGGRLQLATDKDEMKALYRDLAGAFRTQYLLLYSSSHPVADGKWRKVDVKVKRPRVSIQATPGFRAAAELLQ